VCARVCVCVCVSVCVCVCVCGCTGQLPVSTSKTCLPIYPSVCLSVSPGSVCRVRGADGLLLLLLPVLLL